MAANTCTWTTETVSDLIDLFEERPCLYNTKHKDYFNRDLRSIALEEISREIGFPGEYRTCSIIRPPFLHRSSAKKKGGGV